MRPAYLAIWIICFTSLFSCKKDDTKTCTNCSSDQTLTFELCRESNGNASVNGQDTGTDYDLYLADLEATGTNCGI
jgi:hypothetical protein